MVPDERIESVEGAAEAYLKVFQNQGADYFFNSPGSEDAPYWEYLAKHSADDRASVPIHINCRHESVAVNMAKGYTMMTGDPQVVKLHVHSGPLNAAMEINGVYQVGIPMVLLSSYSSTHEGELTGGSPGAHYLDFDHPGGDENNFLRCMKWLANLDTNENAERLLSRAFRIAKSWPKGPTFVNIPRELAYDSEKDEVVLSTATTATPPAPNKEILEKLIKKLEEARNPMIITSWLGRSREVVDNLVTLVEKLQAPVFENQKWHYNFPMDHPLYLGSATGRNQTPLQTFEEEIDLVFVIDCVMPWYPPRKGAPDAEIIMLNAEPVQEKRQYWNYPADMLVTADSTEVLPLLAKEVRPFDGSRPIDWKREHATWERRWKSRIDDAEKKAPIDPYLLCSHIDKCIPNDAIIGHETVVHTPIIQNIISDRSERYQLKATRANGGGLGTSLGVTLGAKLAEPHRTAVVLLGDGAFNYNPVMATFGAAQEYELPLLAVVFNNGSYESMKGNLMKDYPTGWADRTDTFPGADIRPRPDYAKCAEIWDGYGETVRDPKEIEPALKRGLKAIDGGKSAILDVIVERESPDFPNYDSQ